jgi:hypothetical protein
VCVVGRIQGAYGDAESNVCVYMEREMIRGEEEEGEGEKKEEKKEEEGGGVYLDLVNEKRCREVCTSPHRHVYIMCTSAYSYQHISPYR